MSPEKVPVDSSIVFDVFVASSGIYPMADAPADEPGYHIQICEETIVRERRNCAHIQKSLGFTGLAEYLGRGPAGTSDGLWEIADAATKNDVLDELRQAVCDHCVTSFARLAADPGSDDDELGANYIESAAIRTRLAEALDGFRGKKITKYTPLAGADLALCLRVLNHHYPVLAATVNYLFRFRNDEKDGKTLVITRGKDMTGRDKILFGEARKVPAERAALYNETLGYAPDFVVTFSAGEWAGMNRNEREAVCFHELCHCRIDPRTGKPFLADHDVTEFVDVIAEYGAKGGLVTHRATLARFFEAGKQADLLDAAPAESEATP